MPKGQTKHWRRRMQHHNRGWDKMLSEPGVRDRILKESPEILKLLDILAGHTKPFSDGQGWTVFCDWLDKAYASRYYDGLPVPKDISLPEPTRVRCTVFPAAR